MLTKESGLVKVWVQFVRSGIYTLEQVPQLMNLREVVGSILGEEKEKPPM